MPSLMQLDEAVRAFIEEFPHDHWTVVVDATFEHRIDSSEQKAYDEALAAGELLTPPAGTIGRGDRFILQIANRVGATVFSNDSFQEFHAEYPWLFDEGRLMGGKPVPGVGWIFAPRSPVRGAKSRMVTRAAKKAAKKAAPAPSAPEQPPTPRRGRKKKATSASPAASGPMPVPSAPPPGPPPRRRRSGQSGAQPVNEGLAFVEFISEHPIGSRVDGEVMAFTSHGAQIAVGDVRCYVPLRGLGDPAPRAAREVLSRGEVRTFVVQALDAPRRGIDLALPGFEQLEATPPELAPAAAAGDVPAPSRRRRTRTRPEPADQTVGAGGADLAPPAADQASADTEASLPESEAALPPKKATTRKKAPAKKSTAKRSTAKKAPAKRSTAKKSTAKRSTAKRTSTAKKAPAKRTAKKSTAKKSTAKKSTARKSTAKKSTAKKSTARKSPAKRTAKRTTAKKSR